MPEWVDDGETTAVVATAEPCEGCDRPTHCIDLGFEVRLCPDCIETMWAAFCEATGHDPYEPDLTAAEPSRPIVTVPTGEYL